MKLLQSHRNDFPEYYGEYLIDDLNNCGDPLRFDCATRAFRVESLEIDIKANGLTHPIILWDTKHTFPLYVQIGGQRVYVARKLGYTHISAYKITDDIELNRCNDMTLSDDYWEKRGIPQPHDDLVDGITTRVLPQ